MVSLDIGMQILLIQLNRQYLDCQIHTPIKELFLSSKYFFFGICFFNYKRYLTFFFYKKKSILALGWNNYFNLSYVDPVTQQTIVCSKHCILSNDTYQDFTVVDPISATGIRININSWFGSGGGLSFVQIYQSGNNNKLIKAIYYNICKLNRLE